MRIISLNNFHPLQWLATGVSMAHTWLLALYLAEQPGLQEREPGTDTASPTPTSTSTVDRCCWHECINYGYFGWFW